MTLPSTGTISLSQVNVELGRSPTAPISLNDSAVRTLAGKLTGPISLADLRGKSAETFVAPTVSLTNTSAAIGLRSGRIQWNPDGTLTITNGSGVAGWWSAVHAGIGGSYWVKVAPGATTSTAYAGMTPGTWYQISGTPSMTLQNSSSTVEGNGAASVYYSTGGTDASIVASFSSCITWDVGQTH